MARSVCWWVIVGVALVSGCGAVTEEFVRHINSVQSSWVASSDTWTARLTKEEIRGLLGAKIGHPLPRKPTTSGVTLPDVFDSRTNWPNCPTMYQIRDQSSCGACWAFGAVESMSDRNCIFNNISVPLSAEDMNSCSNGGSCNGGYPTLAWDYWVSKGVVSEQCSPFSLPSCDHHIANSTNPCPSDLYPTPECVTECVDGSGLEWTSDKHYGAKAYGVSGETQMMQEIMENGPIETTFHVWTDFLTYSGGIYQHVSGTPEGNHCVKVLGWGVENGEKYWLVANSWNPDWGEQGYFRIKKGNDECGFEDYANAGIPATK